MLMNIFRTIIIINNYYIIINKGVRQPHQLRSLKLANPLY